MSLFLTAGYAFGQPMQSFGDFDFHEVAFALPLLAWLINALDLRKDRQLLAASVLLLFVREDLGTVVFIAGLLRLLDKHKRYWGVLLSVLGLAGFVLTTQVIIPNFNPNGSFQYWQYENLGPDGLSALKFLLTHPLTAIKLLFVPWPKPLTWAWLFVPLLGLPLLSRYTLLALPLLVSRFWATRESLWRPEFHYSAPAWTIVCLAAIAVLGARRPTTKRIVSLALAASLLLIAGIGTAVDFRNFPLRRLGVAAWKLTPTMRDYRSAVDQLPANVCVAADDKLVPQLTKTNRATLPGIQQPTPDFVVLDMAAESVGNMLPGPGLYFDQYSRQGYQVTWRRGDVVILQAGDVTPDPSRCGPTSP